MTDQHPITPPPELRRIWAQQAQRMDPHDPVAWLEHVATKAARWGADQELEACVEWLAQNCGRWELSSALRAARRPPAASAAGRGGGGMSQPLSPVEELQERYRSAADEYPDPDGFAAALRAVADQVVPEPPTWEIGVLSAADREVEIRREILAIADELENHQ